MALKICRRTCRSVWIRGLVVLVLALWTGFSAGSGAEPPPATDGIPAGPGRAAAEDSAESQRMLRSYLQLQEQLHATLLAIEQARLENSSATRTNSEALAGRLELIEKSLAQAREQQAEATRNSNRTMLTLAGIFVGVGFLTLLCMAFFQLRGMNRLAEIATGLPGANGYGQFAALGGGDGRLLGPAGEPVQPSRLQGVIERLEQRIQELEGASHAPATIVRADESTVMANGSSGSGMPDHMAVLLGKGQMLLNLGQSDGALQCFDEALAVSPDHAEAHVKRGMALERLKRFEEAIACYDRAIGLNRQLTQAYLCKGSAFSQQERYSEALECYEQALKSEAVR